MVNGLESGYEEILYPAYLFKLIDPFSEEITRFNTPVRNLFAFCKPLIDTAKEKQYNFFEGTYSILVGYLSLSL